MQNRLEVGECEIGQKKSAYRLEVSECEIGQKEKSAE